MSSSSQILADIFASFDQVLITLLMLLSSFVAGSIAATFYESHHYISAAIVIIGLVLQGMTMWFLGADVVEVEAVSDKAEPEVAAWEANLWE